MTNKTVQHAIHFALWDVIFLTILLLLSSFLISFYFKADFLATGYPDWMVHAFRVKSIAQYGLSSWTHSWANGISLWRSYQFVPHFITVWVMDIFGVDALRAMILCTIGSFIGLRILIYSLLRFLKFHPISAFICALLSFDIAQYWGGVADYSLMFGFTFFPVILFVWVRYYQGHLQNLFPYLAGLSFYIHPILGYTACALWLVAVLFSYQRIISIRIGVQLLILLASSSLFWFPVVHRESYSYTSTVFANKYFLNLVLSAYKNFGLSSFLIGALLLSPLALLTKLPRAFSWSRVLFIFVFSYFILIVIGLNIDLPRAIAQFQFTRGVTIVGLGIIFVIAPIIGKLVLTRSLLIRGTILFVACLALVEGMWFVSEYSPPPGSDYSEAVSTYLENYPNRDLSQYRIWTSSIGTTGYSAPLSYRLPYSYMGHLDSNQISPRVSPLILYQPNVSEIPTASFIRLNDYLKISGVKYLFFDEGSPFTTTLLTRERNMYKDLGTVRGKYSSFHLFEVPWEIRDALLVDPSLTDQLHHFPFNLELTVVNDQIDLDTYVRKFVQTLYKSSNIPLQIYYPSPTTLQVEIPENRKTPFVYMNESYDAGWNGYFNGKEVGLSPSGPNFMLAKLPSLADGGVLVLTHSWPKSFYISLFLIFLIPMQLVLHSFVSSRFVKHYAENKN